MTTFSDNALNQPKPDSIQQNVTFPRRQAYYPSPSNWRDEVLYFLLVDRFSDAQEDTRPLLDRTNLPAARPGLPNGESWRWDRWAHSGGERWQGGTLEGVQSKLAYLQDLGVTTIWLSPVFKQRSHLDTYHGYGIQDFLEVDPRFGDRDDLVALVGAAHYRGMRIILDIIFNHSGANWVYPGDVYEPPYIPFPGRYPFGAWLDGEGRSTEDIQGAEDGVWPIELQDLESYTRAGSGNLGAGDLEDELAEHKRTDFFSLRDFQLLNSATLSNLVDCYKYWIALTDCDGFRIDTLKHVSMEQARNFCGAIKEFAANLGKLDFFMVGEIAGGDYAQDRYLDVLDRNLNAALDIGGMRVALNGVAKGTLPSKVYFDGFDPGDSHMGSHRHLGERHVSILDDHDHVFGEKLRFSSNAASENQVAAGVAIQMLSLGIPCIYYGTEQALGGPEQTERHWLPDWGNSDRYLREALFGPRHPRRAGRLGLPSEPDHLDPDLPGFGAFGTAGQHCFDENHPAYMRITALTSLRQEYPALRYGRQYLRQISNPFLGPRFDFHGPGELLAWSRILDDEELLCVLNAHGVENRGAKVIVDAGLNPQGSELTVILNTAQAVDPEAYSGTHPVSQSIPVKRMDGIAYVELGDIPPSETLVLTNRPLAEEGGVHI
jgi:glycosidase